MDMERARVAYNNEFAIRGALAAFRLDCGRYPTDDEGLLVLLGGSGIKGWNGPYWRPESKPALTRFSYQRGDGDEPILDYSEEVQSRPIVAGLQ
jgi:hypothetical protein